MARHHPDLNITTVVLDGPPVDDCDNCGTFALITVTWTPGDENFGQLHTCFHPDCVSWAVQHARDSARDNTTINIEFERHVVRAHSPNVLEVAA